jgi:hypothetical protein
LALAPEPSFGSRSGRSASTRQNDSLYTLGDPPIHVCLEPREVEAHGETRLCANLSAVGKQRLGQGSGPLESQTEILNEPSSQGDVPDSADGEPTDHAMTRRLSTGDADAREKIVNPLSLDISDKASDINVIGWQ